MWFKAAITVFLAQALIIQAQACTENIKKHFECVDVVFNQFPDHHIQMKQNVDNCFTSNGCAGTPESFQSSEGSDPPNDEQVACVKQTMVAIDNACYPKFGIEYRLPKPNNPPPPPPSQNGQQQGAPDHTRSIMTLCRGKEQVVQQCVDQAHSSGQEMRQKFQDYMAYCVSILEPQCKQTLAQDRQRLCGCVQDELRNNDEIWQYMQYCASLNPRSQFAQVVGMDGLPNEIFMPYCAQAPESVSFEQLTGQQQQAGQPWGK